ncbi:MAG: UbiD family decarboxylase [Halieaceae bacterium]|nr:UbiD family decarboxylase [Halieaceae bacterium]
MKSYLSELSRNNELLEVEVQVDPLYELAAVTKVAQKKSDEALLFPRVKGTDFPVVTNVYSSRKRLCELIGAGDENFCPAWNRLLNDFSEKSEESTRLRSERPEIIEGKLSDLPLITYHEKDVGPYLTSAIFIAKDPLTQVPNLSFHRSMYVNDNELRVRLGKTHDLAKYQHAAEKEGSALEAAILIGVSPSIFLAACASISKNSSELELASKIDDSPLDVYRAKTVDLEIPSETQIVIEGKILPNQRKPEGPFGEFMGYYVPTENNHVFEVSKVYWRKEAIFHSILCGSREDLTVLEAVTAGKIYRHLNSVLPGILDVSCSPAFMNTTIKIKQQYEGHSRQVLTAAFGADLDYNKAVFVVDDDIDITNMNEVIWAFLTRGRADTRTMVLRDVPGFYRDPNKDHWGRLGLDATKPFDRQTDFERKAVPGEGQIDLARFLKP